MARKPLGVSESEMSTRDLRDFGWETSRRLLRDFDETPRGLRMDLRATSETLWAALGSEGQESLCFLHRPSDVISIYQSLFVEGDRSLPYQSYPQSPWTARLEALRRTTRVAAQVLWDAVVSL